MPLQRVLKRQLPDEKHRAGQSELESDVELGVLGANPVGEIADATPVENLDVVKYPEPTMGAGVLPSMAIISPSLSPNVVVVVVSAPALLLRAAAKSARHARKPISS